MSIVLNILPVFCTMHAATICTVHMLFISTKWTGDWNQISLGINKVFWILIGASRSVLPFCTPHIHFPVCVRQCTPTPLPKTSGAPRRPALFIPPPDCRPCGRSLAEASSSSSMVNKWDVLFGPTVTAHLGLKGGSLVGEEVGWWALLRPSRSGQHNQNSLAGEVVVGREGILPLSSLASQAGVFLHLSPFFLIYIPPGTTPPPSHLFSPAQSYSHHWIHTEVLLIPLCKWEL